MGIKKIQLRRDVPENWSLNNPVLSEGEVGVELSQSSAKIKIGDGEKNWNDLDYFGGIGNSFQEITYSELKNLRDSGQLVPGNLYRITDYVTTTVQSETKSAGHPFDIIVLATSENELSHLAKAIAHEGDTYFDGNDLGAWELWYDLDNNMEKYAWADAENGKGVIYRMIDEKRNDCPYDFKNVLFYDSMLNKYHYTFSYIIRGIVYDGTVDRQIANCYSNSMKVYSEFENQWINKNVFCNISFASECYGNTFGNNCRNNVFGSDCYGNTFGDECYGNTFGDNCSSNTFGIYCYGNAFGSACRSNTFGDECYGNTFKTALAKRTLNKDKTLITLNEEYYDDGNGELVPIKHPDLSTQPSILPYKFAGNYVYEQMVCVNGNQIKDYTQELDLINFSDYDLPEESPILLDKNIFINGDVVYGNYIPSHSGEFDFNICSNNKRIYLKRIGANTMQFNNAWIRLVWTKSPNSDNYYYYLQNDEERDYSKEYFTLEILDGEGSSQIFLETTENGYPPESLKYSINGYEWESVSWSFDSAGHGVGSIQALKKGDIVRLQGYGNHGAYGSIGFKFTGNSLSYSRFIVYGNIMSLLYGENFAGQVDLVNGDYPSEGYTFQELFRGSPVVEAKNLILPALTLSRYCYSNMFLDCIFLITAPSVLPATELADRCYFSMFAGCTSLTTAPELPATTLSNECYGYMFSGCTSLTTAPQLPATTLASSCYSNMFYDCTKLNYITMLATNISAPDCLYNWVSGVTSTGTFVKHPDMTSLPSGASGIPEGWEVHSLL